MEQFMIESLMDEQRFLLNCMERTKRMELPEAWGLLFALSDVVTAIRNLRSGQITWFEAFIVYQGSTACRHECELAVLFL